MRWRLAAAGTLIGLALCELLLRLAGPWLPVDLTTRALQELHPVYGVFHRPGASAWIRDPEFKTFVRFNREGLRGPEIPSSPAPGVTRVLVLGDSFVEGAEAEEDQTLPSVMAKRLTEAGFAAEALNGGVRGWGTAQEYLYLTDQGLALHPDIVVLVLYVGNDLVDNSVELSGLAPDGTFSRPFFVLDRGQLVQLPAIPALASAIDPLLHVARSHFTLVNFLESAVAVRLAYADRAEVLRSVHRLVFADPPPTQWEQAWAVTEAVVVAIEEATDAQGIRFLLVAAPHKAQLDATEWDRLVRGSPPPEGTAWNARLPQQRLVELAARHNIHSLDLLPTLQEAATLGPLFFAQNSHWTALGHQAAATAIARAITNRASHK